MICSYNYMIVHIECTMILTLIDGHIPQGLQSFHCSSNCERNDTHKYSDCKINSPFCCQSQSIFLEKNKNAAIKKENLSQIFVFIILTQWNIIGQFII